MIKHLIGLKCCFNYLFAILLLQLIGQGNIAAQQYRHARTFTAQHGLSDNRVTCFYKDVHGYVWIGTKNGLNRFDGHTFKIYKPSKGNAISNEVINDITGDQEGNIWVATMNGLNKLDFATGLWRTWMPDANNPKSFLTNNLVWDVEIDSTGRLWIAADVFAFTSFNPATEEFIQYDWPKFVKTINGKLTPKGYHSIYKFIHKNQDTCWLGTNKGLVMLNTKTREFTFIGGGYNDQLTDMLYDAEKKTVFIATHKGSIWQYDENTKQFTESIPIAEPYPSKHLSTWQTDEYWLSSTHGIIRCGVRDPVLMHHVPSLSFSLPPGGVNTVYKDDHNIYWIGTPNGFCLIETGAKRFFFLPLTAASDKDGVNKMTSVYYDDSLDLYFVTCKDPATVFVIHKSSGEIHSMQFDESKQPFSSCLSVKKSGGRVWLLTESKVYVYNPVTRLFKHYPTPHDGMSMMFNDVAVDDQQNVWLATFANGVFFRDHETKSFKRIFVKSDTLFLRGAMALQKDRDGGMWIATFGNSLHHYQPATGIARMYSEADNNPAYTSLNMVNDLETDEKGMLWLVTHAGGLFNFHKTQSVDKAFQQFNMFNGLHYNEYLSLVKGEKNKMYLMSKKGVSYIDVMQPNKEHVFTQLASFSSFGSDPQVPHRMFYQKQDQELLVPVAGGLIFYYPHQNIELPSFKIVVEQIALENGKLDTLQQFKNLYAIHINHKKLTFRFAGLYFGAEPVFYQHQLEGFDQQWVDANDVMFTSYQNLPKGNYTFKVRALNSNGVVVSESGAIHLVVQPPFWDTLWFKLLVIASMIGMVMKVADVFKQKIRDEKILNQFATSLYGKSTVDDILWEVASNCVKLLGFPDCVVYQMEQGKNILTQRAAAGPKNPLQNREIYNYLELPVGVGVVGSVALTGKAERISNTANDKRYVVDDTVRLSEITVPIMIDGKVFGVIDAEHPKRNYFKKRDLRMLKKIASISAERISKFMTEERLRSKIARDLHDEMGSTLTSINILSKVAMSKKNDEQLVEAYLQKIKSHSSGMMESMSDIVWAINPMNDSIEKLLLRMKELAAELLEPVGISYHFNSNDASSTTLLNLEERKDLYLVFKEALNNAVKYSKASHIEVSLQITDAGIELKVTDNGIGFNTNVENSGNGIKNMRVRAEALGANFNVHSEPGKGTTISMMKSITS